MIISINNLSRSFENINKDPAAFSLAQDIERFADIVDPYSYRDYLESEHNGDISESVNTLYNEIVSGRADYVAEWLAEIIDDPGTDPRDRERAENRLKRYNEYMKNRGMK